MEILTRQQAINIGSKTYFTGVPCKNGHIAKRHTTTCACTGCLKLAYQKSHTKILNAAKGYVTYTRTIHPDDWAEVDAYCDAVNLQRASMLTMPRADMAAILANVYGPDIAAQLQQMNGSK